jgi:hypothetical protein
MSSPRVAQVVRMTQNAKLSGGPFMRLALLAWSGRHKKVQRLALR